VSWFYKFQILIDILEAWKLNNLIRWAKIFKLLAKDVLPNVNRTQAAERVENAIFCPWWPWPSNSSEGGIKQVFRVNLSHICSAVPEIFHTQTKNHRLTAPKTEPYTVHCVWVRTMCGHTVNLTVQVFQQREVEGVNQLVVMGSNLIVT